jgi:predicted dehydrogenase
LSRCSDVVLIASPTAFHYKQALQVLEAGKHLFLEKPVCLTLQECDHLIACANETSGFVQVGYNLRHHRLVRRAKSVVATGMLGDIRALHSVLTSSTAFRLSGDHWRSRRALGGGTFLEMATHHFDLWRFLTSLEIEEIQSFGTSEPRLEDNVSVTQARLTGNVLANATVCQSTAPVNQLEILGTLGRLRLSLHRFDGLEFVPRALHEGDARWRLNWAVQSFRNLPSWLKNRRLGGDYIASFQDQWYHFARCLKDGRDPSPGLAEGREALRLSLEAIPTPAR